MHKHPGSYYFIEKEGRQSSITNQYKADFVFSIDLANGTISCVKDISGEYGGVPKSMKDYPGYTELSDEQRFFIEIMLLSRNDYQVVRDLIPDKLAAIMVKSLYRNAVQVRHTGYLNRLRDNLLTLGESDRDFLKRWYIYR